jgi:hypothetical protein
MRADETLSEIVRLPFFAACGSKDAFPGRVWYDFCMLNNYQYPAKRRAR